MPVVKRRAFWLLFLAFVSPVVAANNPPKLALIARFDLSASPEAGELHKGEFVLGSGSVTHPNWLPPAEQARGYTVECPITRFATNEFSLRFVPQRSGPVTLSLMGPWEEASKGLLYQKEILWDSLRVTGATIANDAWAKAVKPVRAWHDRRVDFTLYVAGNTPVTLEFQARPVVPDSLSEMKRVTNRNSAAHQAAKRFRRGAELLNHLEAPPGQDWGGKYADEDFVQMRSEGFDHVRLPVAWQHYAGPRPEYTIPADFFNKTDRLITNALNRRLNVIVDLHHFVELSENPVAQTEKFYALWRQIAAHYATAPDGLAFELLNEPHGAATTPALNVIYAEALRQIRQTNPRRTVFIDPGKWNAIGDLPELSLPENDDNLIVTVHCYEPYYFARQGAEWLGPDMQVKDIRFPGPPETPLVPDASLKLSSGMLDWLRRYNTLPADKNPSGPRAFRALIEQAQQWSQYFGRPVQIGEFGCTLAADPASRARYYRSFREAAEEAGLGWTLNDWKMGYRYWDERAMQPAPGLREALFPDTATAKGGAMIHPQLEAVLEQLQAEVTNAQVKAAAEIGQLRAQVALTQQKTQQADQRLRWFLLGSAGAVILGLAALLWSGKRPRTQSLVPLTIANDGAVSEVISYPSRDPNAALPAATALPATLAVAEQNLPKAIRPHFGRWLAEKLMRRLLSERASLLATQKKAEQELAEFERRLEKVHAPLQERLRAYEKRITELEQELALKGAENRELIKATISLARKRLEAERAKNPLALN